MKSLKALARRILHTPATVLVEAAARVAQRGLATDEEMHARFARRGFHLLRHSYYLPIPEAGDVAGSFWESTSELVGVAIDDEAALHLLERDLAPFIAEFRGSFATSGSSADEGFYLVNGSFMAVDAHIYYALIRHLKPKRVVEVGSGWSTMLASAAAVRNRREGMACDLVAIEPYPPRMLRGLAGLSRLVESKVQHVPLEEFAALEAGDILFIDSSHVLKAGGDVQYEFLEILPRLKPGVYVHVHDVSLPRQYPRAYYERRLYWNEQYLLQAFLAFNARFEVVWPGNHVMLVAPDRLIRAIPEIAAMRAAYPSSEPTSFWMRVVES